jgi:hypothetical protein
MIRRTRCGRRLNQPGADEAAGECNEKRHSCVSGASFMVKLLRACVWMPWRGQAKKDVASCEKSRGDASNQ